MSDFLKKTFKDFFQINEAIDFEIVMDRNKISYLRGIQKDKQNQKKVVFTKPVTDAIKIAQTIDPNIKNVEDFTKKRIADSKLGKVVGAIINNKTPNNAQTTQPAQTAPATQPAQTAPATQPAQTAPADRFTEVQTTVISSAKQQDGINVLNNFIRFANTNKNLDITSLNTVWYRDLYNDCINRTNYSAFIAPQRFFYYPFVDFVVFLYSDGGQISDSKTIASNFANNRVGNNDTLAFMNHLKKFGTDEKTIGKNPILYYQPFSKFLQGSIDQKIKELALEKDGDSLGYFFIMQCISENKTLLGTLTEAVNVAEDKNILERDIIYVLNNPLKNVNVPKTKTYLADIARALEQINQEYNIQATAAPQNASQAISTTTPS